MDIIAGLITAAASLLFIDVLAGLMLLQIHLLSHWLDIDSPWFPVISIGFWIFLGSFLVGAFFGLPAF